MKKHTKHTSLTKPFTGKWGRNEFAFLGAPCGVIEQLMEELAIQLNSTLKVGRVDASHKKVDADAPTTPFHVDYLDEISGIAIQNKPFESHFQRKKILNECQVTLVNGNHFHAQSQIVVLNKKKEDSLHRKLDRRSLLHQHLSIHPCELSCCGCTSLPPPKSPGCRLEQPRPPF